VLLEFFAKEIFGIVIVSCYNAQSYVEDKSYTILK